MLRCLSQEDPSDFHIIKERQFLYFKCQTAWKSVKCITKEKKKDKLSYIVMLHYLAATGGFVCRFLVHLRDFRQMDSWVS